MRARKYPMDIHRNKEPDCAWLMPKDSSISGISGEISTRATKVRKKMSVINKIDPILDML
jgi:hypothetical protein